MAEVALSTLGPIWAKGSEALRERLGEDHPAMEAVGAAGESLRELQSNPDVRAAVEGFVPPEAARGISSFFDPSRPDSERRAAMAEFSHGLEDRTFGLLQAVATALPPETMSALVEAIPEGKWRTLVERLTNPVDDKARPADDFGLGLPGKDKAQPRKKVGQWIQMLQAAGRVEAPYLQQIAFNLSPEAVEKVGTFVEQFLKDFGGSLRGQLDGLGLDTPDARLQAAPKVIAGLVHETGFQARVGQLQSELKAMNIMSPEALDALMVVVKDVSAVARVGALMVGITRADRNRKLTPEQRSQQVLEVLKRGQVVDLKVMQVLTSSKEAAESLTLKPETLAALASVQDRAPPMPEEQVTALLKEQYGDKLPFKTFEKEPFRAASIAQIHRATLPSGERVAVKLQRPGLSEQIDEAQRAASFWMRVLGESTAMEREKDFSTLAGASGEPDLVRSRFNFFGRMVQGVISSLRDELDFVREAKAQRAARADARGARHIYVPKVYPKLSGPRVLVTKFVDGYRISGGEDLCPSWMSRFKLAQEARGLALPTGPLPSVPTEAEAEAVSRAQLWARQRTGLAPELEGVKRTARGFTVRLRFADPLQKPVVLKISQSGALRGRGRVPDLSLRAVERLRDRLTAAMVTQALVHRLVHGDAQGGNILVLPDGKTIALLDFGQMVKLRLRDYAAPFKMVLGLICGQDRLAAKGLLDLTEQARSLKGSERKALVDQLAKELPTAIGDSISPNAIRKALKKPELTDEEAIAAFRSSRLLRRLKLLKAVDWEEATDGVLQEVLNKHDLFPDSKYSQLGKSYLALKGSMDVFKANLEALGGTASKPSKARLAGYFVKEMVSKPSPHRLATQAIKAHAVGQLSPD
jgi:predicted unusual protein kinase regulating ubiquinone biosynthesis (AarF/ABC1/UbiB family)